MFALMFRVLLSKERDKLAITQCVTKFCVNH